VAIVESGTEVVKEAENQPDVTNGPGFTTIDPQSDDHHFRFRNR